MEENNPKNGSVLATNPPNLPLPAEESKLHGCTKQKRKKLIIAGIIIGITLLVIGLFYLGFAGKLETCTTSTCVRAASEIKKHLDTGADPCDDFYRFSCGNFVQNTNLQTSQGVGSFRSVEDFTYDEISVQIRDLLQAPIQNEDPKAFNVAKKFYRSCLDESSINRQGLTRIKQIFKSSGGWPTLEGSNWKESEFEWTKAIHKLRELGLDFNVFFRITVEKDEKFSSIGRPRNILTIHEIPYSQIDLSSEVKSMIFEYMVELAVKFGAERNVAYEDAREVLRILEELSEISKESHRNQTYKEDKRNKSYKEENRNKKYKENYRNNQYKEDYERLAVSELQYKYPDIQWHHFINGILKPTERINYDDEVVIVQPRYVQFMEHFLGVTSKRSLANIISWHTFQYLINFMPQDIIQKAYELVDRINGKMMNFKIPRWKTCVDAAKSRLSPVLSAAYIQNFLPEDTRFKVISMMQNIKKQFENNLARLEWMDKETKELIIQKLHSCGEKIPSYGDLLNILQKNKLYGQVYVNETNFLDAVLKLNLVQLHQEQKKLREIYEDDSFSNIDFVAGLDIKYIPIDNMLTFPVGIFSGIYYQNDRPEYMNYGILGSIIAHEVSHIFMRAQHGDLPYGNLRSWWSSNSLANYDEKLQCLSNQHSNFRVAELSGKQVNPIKMYDEEMADLAGFKVAYDTYASWVRKNGAQPLLPGLNYSPNQLFWISAGIRHCSKNSPQDLDKPNYISSLRQFRINGPLQNLNDFTFDFGCKSGSRMNPSKKCEVW